MNEKGYCNDCARIGRAIEASGLCKCIEKWFAHDTKLATSYLVVTITITITFTSCTHPAHVPSLLPGISDGQGRCGRIIGTDSTTLSRMALSGARLALAEREASWARLAWGTGLATLIPHPGFGVLLGCTGLV